VAVPRRGEQWPPAPVRRRRFPDPLRSRPFRRRRAPADRRKHRRDGPISLLSGRLRDQWHGMSRTGTVARLFNLDDEPLLSMHPADLRQRGLAAAMWCASAMRAVRCMCASSPTRAGARTRLAADALGQPVHEQRRRQRAHPFGARPVLAATRTQACRRRCRAGRTAVATGRSAQGGKRRTGGADPARQGAQPAPRVRLCQRRTLRSQRSAGGVPRGARRSAARIPPARDRRAVRP
jgi:anaerobic selenocysteine-containing dehydrogenase